ncbi:MAG: hypothetical protein M1541_01490 [Acidobacteria bacterium]|nr:hypothetical protein [Acidobacteriota bacterium]
MRPKKQPKPFPSARIALIPDWAAWAAICVAALVFFRLYAFSTPPLRIGDGYEYMVMACNWARHLTPWVGHDALLECAKETNWPAAQAVGTFIRNPRVGYDPFHFWLLSLLAAPFAAACRMAGTSLFYAFPLLYLAMVCGIAWRLVRTLGQARAACVLLILACSPLIFWSNKAHSEFFVAGGVLLAFAALYRRRTLEAAFWLGIVANQQLTLAPFGLGLAAVWLLADRARRLDWRAWLKASPAVAAPLLCPAYTELRYGMFSLINLAGTNDYSAVSPRRALALFIDPDIGLFPNWPLGLALAIAAIACAMLLRKKMRDLAGMAAFTACWFVLLPLLMTVQTNWNSGGTVFVSRYALYHIPPIAVWSTLLVFRLARRYAPGPHRPFTAAAIALLVCAAAFVPFSRNLRTFHPAQGERYLEHSRFANWFYARWPGLYDPTPEVFIERTLASEQPSQYYGPGTWAVSNSTCSKLLLVRSPEEMRKMTTFDKPMGCLSEMVPREIALGVIRGTIRPTPLGYLNLP